MSEDNVLDLIEVDPNAVSTELIIENAKAELEDGTVMADPSVVVPEGQVGVTEEQLNADREDDEEADDEIDEDVAVPSNNEIRPSGRRVIRV